MIQHDLGVPFGPVEFKDVVELDHVLEYS
jgi:hypothetical protein